MSSVTSGQVSNGAHGPRRRGRPRGDGPGSRQALLAAAKLEFAERGYDGAATRDIVLRAGVSAPVLYHHFGNKAGLYEAVAVEVNDAVIGAFEAAVAGRPALVDKVHAILDVSVVFQATDPSLSRFVVAAPVEVTRHSELAHLGPQMARLRTFFEELCRSEKGLGVTRKQAVRTLLAVVHGLSRLAATLPPREYVEAVEGMRRLVDGTFFPAAPA
jgi:AcrR family transcriptional regulator